VSAAQIECTLSHPVARLGTVPEIEAVLMELRRVIAHQVGCHLVCFPFLLRRKFQQECVKGDVEVGVVLSRPFLSPS
jgi:hypothetical protein